MVHNPTTTMDRKIMFQYVIPITLLVFANVHVVWQVTDTDGGPDRLYGFPLPYATSAYACTFCEVIAVIPLAIDLASLTLVVWGSASLFQRSCTHLPTKPWSTVLAMVIAIFSLVLHFFFGIIGQDNFWRLWLDLSYRVVDITIQFGPLGL